MDAELEGALTAAAVGDGDAEEWCGLVGTAHTGKLELVGRLYTEIDDLPGEYAKARAWTRVVELFGEDWAGWNGTGPHWREYRDWLYSAADARDSALYAAAYERLEPLNDMAFEQRAGRLREFGFAIEASEDTIRAAADELYLRVVAKLIEDDPVVSAQLDQDPDLAQRIYAETLQRLR